ncbi:MAG TPA: hypothetical protein DCY74_06510 [Clostridiales bacterium]|jgi:predicted dehydrogenase|nr:hypothetical protein [Clostridiales bacterium]
MEKVRYGVIGLRMGGAHTKGIFENEKAELVAICDTDSVLMEKVAELYHPKRTTENWEDIVNAPDIDAVVVATPDQWHEAMTVAALEKGKHVICEKPMALSLDECIHMIEASKRTGKKLMVGQVCRYAPAFVKAKEMVESGTIGELYFVESEYAHDYIRSRGVGEWRLDSRRHGILGGGCHAMDLLCWIAGKPEEVFAYANHKMLRDWPTDDTTIAVMKYPNGVIGKVFCSISCKRTYTMRSVFYGSKGTIICDNTSPEMTLFIEDKEPEKIPVDIKNHNVSAEMIEMTNAILEDREPATTGYDGAYTVAACLAAVKSSKTGVPVKIRYPQ